MESTTQEILEHLDSMWLTRNRGGNRRYIEVQGKGEIWIYAEEKVVHLYSGLGPDYESYGYSMPFKNIAQIDNILGVCL